MLDYVFKDHQPSAMECEACLRGLWRHKPSALQGEARLCGRERIIYEGRCTPRPLYGRSAAAPLSYAPLAVGVNPSASQGEARLRGLLWIISSKTTRGAAPRATCTGAALLRPPRMRLEITSIRTG